MASLIAGSDRVAASTVAILLAVVGCVFLTVGVAGR
jgi:hypothetical protein